MAKIFQDIIGWGRQVGHHIHTHWRGYGIGGGVIAALAVGRYGCRPGPEYADPAVARAPAEKRHVLQNLDYDSLYFQTDGPLRQVDLDLDGIYRGEGLELTLEKWEPSIMPVEKPEKGVLISKKPDTSRGLRVVLIGDDCQQQFIRAIENLRTNEYAVRIKPGSHNFPRYNYARSGRLPYPVYINGNMVYIDDFDFISLVDTSEFELGQKGPDIRQVKIRQEVSLYPEEPTEWGAVRLIDRIDGLNRGCISQYRDFTQRVTRKAEQELYNGLTGSTQDTLNRSRHDMNDTLGRAEQAAKANLAPSPRARSNPPSGSGKIYKDGCWWREAGKNKHGQAVYERDP